MKYLEYIRKCIANIPTWVVSKRQYAADILTWLRIVLSLGVAIWALFTILGQAEKNYIPIFIFVISVISLMTDVGDGSLARRYPYLPQEEARLWYRRKDSHAFDNAGDTFMYFSVVLLLATSDRLWLFFYLPIAIAFTSLFFGWVQWLKKKESPRAEIVDVVFGWFFFISFFVMLVLVAKLAIPEHWGYFLVIGVFAVLVFAPSKWDRITTRPESRPKKRPETPA